MTKQPQALTPSEMRFHDFYATATDSLDYRACTWNSKTDEIESKIGVSLSAFHLLRMAQVSMIEYEGFDPSLIIWTDFSNIPKQNKSKRKISAPSFYWIEAVKLSPLVEQLEQKYFAKYGKTIQEAGKTLKITRK